MTEYSELRIFDDLDFVECGMHYIAIGGDADPIKEIDPQYLGPFADWEYKQYQRDHPEAKDPQDEWHIYLSLAKTEFLDRDKSEFDQGDFENYCERMNVRTAKLWADENRRELNQKSGDRKKWHGLVFEKYFYAVVHKGKLQGTSYINPVYAADENGIMAYLEDAREEHKRRTKQYQDRDPNYVTVAFDEAAHEIKIIRVVVNWGHMIRQNHASYMVMHKPEDFDWNLGDEYDANGSLTATDYRKTFPRNYRYHTAEETSRMMINIEIMREVSKATGDTYDRLKSEGRLLDGQDEIALIREYRARKARTV